ncbi:hypothetical protein EXIGLDRAFT_645072 [Exidia glandulosa HHB12029]|uniref:Uncharacterized protein n=1 Tax=Exidia glandulosa HHB12029 TaxID=1314781 RepID=A0A165JAX4_EXIGL|nr:hypothetical protein EXIGLDRAFT_645072 [Exidia glandulosa HHB12029]
MDSVLQEIADAPTLSHDQSAQWLQRVENDIGGVKTRIHERIERDRPTFDRQYNATNSIKTKIASLTRDIDALEAAKQGIIVNLTTSLANNSVIQQEALDASTLSNATAHLLASVRAFHAASDHVRDGRLPEAIAACTSVLSALDDAPAPLGSSKVARDLRARVSTMQHKVQEQLSALLSRCVSVIAAQRTLTLHTSENAISLRDICSSISREFLTAHLNSLRKDLLAHFVEPILQSPVAVTVEADMLALHHSDDPEKRLQSLSALLRFLHARLLPNLPQTVSDEFAASLYSPLVNSVLHGLLEPSLPSRLQQLPAFLSLVREAVDFETLVTADLSITRGAERTLKDWADKAPSYYEKGRRQQLLQEARTVLLGESSESVRVDAPSSDEHVDHAEEPEPAKEDPQTQEDDFENSWDFEDDKAPANGRTSTDSWGFDDDAEAEADVDVEMKDAPAPTPVPTKPPEIAISPSDEDSSNGWGWDDDGADPDVDSVDKPADADEDDPWESAWAEPPKPPASAPAQVEAFPPSSPMKPKAATRLEKKFAKSKGLNVPTTPMSANPIGAKSFASSQHDGFQSQPVSAKASPQPGPSFGRKPPPPKEKATFMISQSALTTLDIAKRALAEGRELSESSIFDEHAASSARGGAALLNSASSVLDLFRAVLPVKDTPPFGGSALKALRFSNDCLYLSHAVLQLRSGADGAKTGQDPEVRWRDALEDVAHRLRDCSTHWFEDTLVRLEFLGLALVADEDNQDRRREVLLDLLGAAEGFLYVGDAEQFLQCKTIVEQLAKDITKLAKDWKPTLTKHAYYTALGTLVDGVLAQMIDQIIALDDIPDVESRHLSQLCRLLTHLEGLFVDEHTGSSLVVVHVPSWLKFSYLSELLEASLTDISYLFDEGALIDFETEELVKLIRALFADTPLRANAITKISAGHVQS